MLGMNLVKAFQLARTVLCNELADFQAELLFLRRVAEIHGSLLHMVPR